MAKYWIIVVSLLLLILNATQACSVELDFTKPECLSTMQGIKTAMECFSNATSENLLFQRENQDSMNKLTELVLQLKDQISQQNINIESMKNKSTDLQRMHNLKEDNDAKNKTIEDCAQQVQGLDTRLHESLQRIQELEAIVQKYNQTVKTQKKETNQSLECSQPELQAVKTVVEQFNSNKDQHQLGRDLEAVLDHGSEAYRQLQNVSSDGYSMYSFVRNGQTELVPLLLCAGLNVTATDSFNNNILHGAAASGNVPLVKYLLEHGAGVDVPGQRQYTALMWAVYFGHLPVVDILVRAGASTTALDYLGNTPLGIATFYGRTAVAQYLRDS